MAGVRRPCRTPAAPGHLGPGFRRPRPQNAPRSVRCYVAIEVLRAGTWPRKLALDQGEAVLHHFDDVAVPQHSRDPFRRHATGAIVARIDVGVVAE